MVCSVKLYMLTTPDADNLMSLCKPTSFQADGDGSATSDPWSICPSMFLVYHLLTLFYLELYNFSVQKFSTSTFGSASPQQVCFSLGSYTSCIALPHLRSLKTTTIFSLTEPRANGYLVPGPEGLRDLPVPARTPGAHPTSRTPRAI